MKAESQEVRREYPVDKDLFIASLADQVKLLRNHASLFLWCGGNEYPPAPGLDLRVSETLTENDGTRFYLNESTSSDLLINTIGNTADGPYNIKEPKWFFTQKWFPFNPEMGSVGLPNIENMSLLMEKKDIIPPSGDSINEVWKYHKYLGYGDMIERFGAVKDVNDFFMKAQIVGYDQYRAIQEGYNNHMWEWYTGLLIWKSQNPWTALKGQFYDWFLDPNATFYGYRHGAVPLHGQYNPADSCIYIVNSVPKDKKGLRIETCLVDPSGNVLWSNSEEMEIAANSVVKKWKVDFSKVNGSVTFLRVKIIYTSTGVMLDDNTYWIPAVANNYAPLFEMPETQIAVSVLKKVKEKYIIDITNSGTTVAFFVRIMVAESFNKTLVSPVLADDNYITLLPGEKRTMAIDVSLLSDEKKNTPLYLEITGVNIKISHFLL